MSAVTSLPPNSRCLVTGASDPKSIGYACARALLDCGASHVTILGRDDARVQAAIASLTTPAGDGSGDNAVVHGVVGDLKNVETMEGVVQQAVEKMGGLDILVIAGGNGGSEYLGLDAKDPDSYRFMYNVAVLSPMMLTQAAAPFLSQKSDQGGTVVMVSSMAPRVPWPDTAPYNYARAAQNAMIETLAFQYRADNIRVNGVLPACIHTGALDRMAAKKHRDTDEYARLRAEAHPLGRNGTPQDVANAVVFLASPASSFTTGELLQVDGGLHLSNWFNKPKLLNEFEGGTTEG